MKVLKLNENEFVLMTGTMAIYGSLARMVRVLTELGVDLGEIEAGLIAIADDKNLAVYGINRTFIYADKIA